MNAWRTRLPATILIALASKGYKPPEWWNARSFAKHGEGMIRTLSRVARITQRKAWSPIIRGGRSVMQEQVDRVIQRAVSRSRSAKAEAIVLGLADEAVWVEALNSVFSEMGGELRAEIAKPIQAVAQAGHTRTAKILGVEADPRRAAGLLDHTRTLAERIVGIDHRTKEKFRSIITDSIQQEAGLNALVERLQGEFMDWSSRRLVTIARTETSNAWNAGTIAGMREIPTLEEIDVIGCESREEDRWNSPSYQQFMYRGESTCNIEGVPIGDAHLLNFHPNHTGAIVPSKFRDEGPES